VQVQACHGRGTISPPHPPRHPCPPQRELAEKEEQERHEHHDGKQERPPNRNEKNRLSILRCM